MNRPPRYLLDTSIIIWVLRERQEIIAIVERLHKEGEVYSSYICLAELFEGVRRVSNQTAAEQQLLELFATFEALYGLDIPIAKQFGQIRAGLKASGKTIEDLDILIASTCLAYDLTLVTGNPKHFSRIPNLKVLAV